MSKVTIAGSSYVITSSVSLENLETVKKHRPSALALVEPETKETLFKVGVGTNSISEYGISFGGVSNGDEKFATATLKIPDGTEDAKQYVLDTAGVAIANLNKVEANITKALEEIRAERNRIAENISVSV